MGTELGSMVKEKIEKNECITSVVSLLELSYKSEKEGWNTKEYLDYIKIKSQIIGIKDSSILEFGKLYNSIRKKEKDFGFADCIILSTSIDEEAQILTKDSHFRNIKNSIILK